MGIFNQISIKRNPRSLFNMSYNHRFSCQAGRLYPSMLQEVLPGDKWMIDHQAMTRAIPLVAPLMHEADITIHTYFVPTRIIWPNFYKWLTGELETAPPYFTGFQSNPLSVTSLGNYMRLPLTIGSDDIRISALPAAAYAAIWSEYYRAQQFQDELIYQLPDIDADGHVWRTGLTGREIIVQRPMYRAWQHDYFTSALPEAQAGDAVTLPLTNDSTVPVELSSGTLPNKIIDANTRTTVPGGISEIEGRPTNNDLINPLDADRELVIDPNGQWTVDVNAEAVTINTFRRAQRIQMWLEKKARAGTQRATEYLQAFWGVVPEDSRMQRPEFIGGTKGSLMISEVLSSAQTQVGDSVTPVGQMAGHGINVQGGNKFRYNAKEHGFIVSFYSIRPKTAYQQGVHRMYLRHDKFDYADPLFGNLGEQDIKYGELYADLDPTTFASTFGYIPRYAEYKYINDVISGSMQTTENFWTWSRIFNDPPELNEEFITCRPRTDIFAFTDPNIDHFYAMVYNNAYVLRQLPKYGTPHL